MCGQAQMHLVGKEYEGKCGGRRGMRVSSGFVEDRCDGSNICYDGRRDADVQVALDRKRD